MRHRDAPTSTRASRADVRHTGVVGIAATAVATAGVVYRAIDLGRYGFWNDEAWVAITTRVALGPQFWLSLSSTPVGWALLLRLVPAGVPPEYGLRAIPFLFGCAMMWIAWRLGARVGGHPLPGLLALATVALDPLDIAFSKNLKQYTAEGFFALLALERLHVATMAPSSRATWGLVLALCGGAMFANTQVFVAPPIMAALAWTALAHRDRARLIDAVAATAVVGLGIGLWYALVIAPRIVPAMQGYFITGGPTSVAGVAVHAWGELRTYVGDMLGDRGFLAGVAALAVACVLHPPMRPIALALVLLLVEMIGLGQARLVPWSYPRVLLFLYATVGVVLATAVGHLAARAGRDGRVAPIAAAAVLLLVADAAMRHDWRRLADVPRIEDAGALVRQVEAERTPEDVLLVYGRTRYIYAYYQRAVPVLDPAPVAVGWLPRLSDPRVHVVDRTNVLDARERTHADAASVWFVGSRLDRNEAFITTALTRGRTVDRRVVRPDALLLRTVRRE